MILVLKIFGKKKRSSVHLAIKKALLKYRNDRNGWNRFWLVGKRFTWSPFFDIPVYGAGKLKWLKGGHFHQKIVFNEKRKKRERKRDSCTSRTEELHREKSNLPLSPEDIHLKKRHKDLNTWKNIGSYAEVTIKSLSFNWNNLTVL